MNTRVTTISKTQRLLWSGLAFLGIWILSYQTSDAQPKPIEVASDCRLLGADCVAIPRADWSACRAYKADSQVCRTDLTTCRTQGRTIRGERDQCRGKLNGQGQIIRSKDVQLSDLQSRNLALSLKLNQRHSAAFWFALGSTVAFGSWTGGEWLTFGLTGKISPVRAVLSGVAFLGSGLFLAFQF